MTFQLMKPLITFDVDGVICGGEFIEMENRIPEVYLAQTLIDPRIPGVINGLFENFTVGVITARHIKYQAAEFDDTKEFTGRQLRGFGIEVDKLGFLIPLIAGQERVRLLNYLNPLVHFDDDPTVSAIYQEGFYRGFFVDRAWSAVEKWDKIIRKLNTL